MPDLYITFAQPNPKGKDRPPHTGPTNDQLNEEWVEFTNPTKETWDLQGVTLTHTTFNQFCQRTSEAQLMTFKGSMQPGRSVRVHTGAGADHTNGTLTHLYAGRSNYVWNNRCGDTATLYSNKGATIDWASYAPNPPEGVLRRVPGTNTLR